MFFSISLVCIKCLKVLLQIIRQAQSGGSWNSQSPAGSSCKWAVPHQGEGRLQFNSSCGHPATLLPLAGYFEVSHFPRAFETDCRQQAVFCWQLYVTALSDV